MALKKSQLYSSLWKSCDALRGGMDASQYKDYILTLLFMKYVSDKHAASLIIVPKGASFADISALKGHKDIGEEIDKIIAKLAEANDLGGVIDIAVFNNEDKLGKGKDMQERLSKLVAIFEGLDFRSNRAEGDDLLGDAYEYLMRHFATESGKSKGQFYTPAEVSRIMAKVIGIGPNTRQDQSIYDLTCGSGSLLLKGADEAPRGLSIYGQENDLATWALARMNMFLHRQPTHEIWKGNTLSAPHYRNPDGSLKTFDFAVANPPFSAKEWSTGLDPWHDEFHRFNFGVPPAKNGDYAFLLHLIKSLKSTGKGAIILPHGVLFRGNSEGEIRKNIIKAGLIKGIIGLPPNLFYGTGIPACIVVIDKEHAHARTGIFVIDASKGFMKDGPKNRLRAQDIHKIVDTFARQADVPGYSRMVPVAEIASPANDYNLNIPRYIDSSEPEDIQDLDAHLRGGIPQRDINALEPYWKVFTGLRSDLVQPGDRPGYLQPKVAASEVKATILGHPQFQAFSHKVADVFDHWRAANESLLRGVNEKTKPKEVITTLSEDILGRFAGLPLLDKYDLYQRLMEYWDEVMQDDVYLLVSEGWLDAAKPRAVIDDPARGIKEEPDLTVNRKKYKMDLIPPALIAAKYFAKDLARIEELEAKALAASQELAEYVEEHGGEDSALEDAKNDKGEVTKAGVKDLLKKLKGDAGSADDYRILARSLELLDAESSADSAVKQAQAELDGRVLAKYSGLSETDIKTLVVADKWLASVRTAIEGEVQRLIQVLAGRLKELEQRYQTPMPALAGNVADLESKVTNHLKKMGYSWT